MKGCFSLLLALLVLLLLVAGGYFLYQRMVTGSSSGPPTVTLENQTAYGLTVTMRNGTTLEHFVISPGKSETRTMQAGMYSVEGSISDPNTTAFSGTWTLEKGGKYTGGFQRSDGGSGGMTHLVLAH
ncbi:MAG TPA: hypothetical protein VII12_00805 [Thermoanaerobaculia bacterium]|jgi:hypothetical protein